MRRLVAPVLAPFIVLTMLLAGSLAWAAPAGAAPRSTSPLPRAAGQEVGDTVALFSTDGDEVGSVTVTGLVDGFQATEEQQEFELDGERIVSLDVEIEADGADLSVDPANFFIVDSTGVAWIDVALTRTDGNPSLEATELEDGDAVSGSLEIAIPVGLIIDRVLYLVDSERVLTLVDTPAEIEAGDVVDVFTSEGDAAGSIVADQVFEEFEDVEEGSEPGRDERFYGLVVTAEATGAEPLPLAPELFIAVDRNGIVFPVADSIERTADSVDEFPDLESVDLGPGDAVTGFIGFVLAADAPLAYVAYLPENRFYPIIETVGASDDATTPAADDDDPLGPTDDGDCAGVADWEDASVELVQNWGTILGLLDFADIDLDLLRESAGEIEDIAAAQADSDPPAIAEELNDILVESYQDSAQALNDLADAVEAGDDAGIGKAAEDIQVIGESFQTGGDVDDILQALRADCPDEVDEL